MLQHRHILDLLDALSGVFVTLSIARQLSVSGGFEDHVASHPFRKQQSRQNGIDADFGPDGNSKTLDELELCSFSHGVGHAGAALAHCLSRSFSINT